MLAVRVMQKSNPPPAVILGKEVVAKSIKALNHKDTKNTKKSFSFVYFCLCGSLLSRALWATSKSDICRENWIPTFMTHGGGV